MQHWARLGVFVSLCFIFSASLLVNQSYAQTADPRYYDIGNPTVVDIFIDPVNGDDANDGSSRASGLKTLKAAWDQIPYNTELSIGYRINILPGVLPCASYCSNYFALRYGTYQNPIIIRAADGRGTATIQGGLNFYSVKFLYLIDLNIVAGNGVGAFSNNVIHFDRVYHLLMRGLTLTGLNPSEFQEVIKANQSQVIYLEDSDISGARSAVVDFFAVQWGHIVNNRIHDAGSWGMYLKGGSAYFRIEGNEIYNCYFGFSAGEGSNLSYLEPPFLHYEVYDIKFINNVLHNLPGTAMNVAGGYNVLLAHNTLYQIAYAAPRSYGLFTVSHGGRICDSSDGSCKRMTDQGAWGPDQPEDPWSSYVIPNRNVFIYNNVFYNPAPYRTYDVHLVVYGPANKPATFQNMPDYLPTDENLQIRGNVIWNGPSSTPLGVEYEIMGCKPSNPTCNAEQLRADNTFNLIEPQFRDPANADFHLLPDVNLARALSFVIPDFSWADSPPVPLGYLSNSVGSDRDNSSRSQINPPGAYTIPTAFIPAAKSAEAVSAASYKSPVAVESLVAAFGVNLSPTTAAASSSPLPTNLAGTSVSVRDSAGVARLSPLFLVSPSQVNYQIPQGTARGAATVSIENWNGSVSLANLQITDVAPGIFSADASGQGLASASVLRVRADGSQRYEPVARFDTAQNRFVAVPIDFGDERDQVFLILYCTGLRYRSTLSAVRSRVGGVDSEVVYAGQQGFFIGVDQVNIRLPRSLAGRGEVDVVLTVDLQTANTVRVRF